jgi:hypothetical protein
MWMKNVSVKFTHFLDFTRERPPPPTCSSFNSPELEIKWFEYIFTTSLERIIFLHENSAENNLIVTVLLYNKDFLLLIVVQVPLIVQVYPLNTIEGF